LIPCLNSTDASSWMMILPEGTSDYQNEITYGFSSPILADLLTFDFTSRALILNLD
jgi:hypothetical protein